MSEVLQLSQIRTEGEATTKLEAMREAHDILVDAGAVTAAYLPAMLERASNAQETDLERRAMTIAGLLEPALILVMGVVVLLIVLAVLMPIIEINQLVR